MLGGQVITEAEKTGLKAQTYVIAAGAVLARQLVNTPDTNPTQHVAWEHRDPGDTEVKFTDSSGNQSANFTSSRYDPLGRMVGFPTFELPNMPPHRVPSPFNEVPEELGGDRSCQVPVDGILQDCSWITVDNTEVSDSRHGDKLHPDHHRLDDRLPGVLRHWVPGEIIDEEDIIDDHGVVRITTHETPGHWQTIGNWNFGHPSQNQSPSVLKGKDLQLWQVERSRLLLMLTPNSQGSKSDCLLYLEKKGFDVDKILSNLRNQVPYDAFSSTNDANEDFGHLGITVMEFFDNWRQQNKPFEGAATGSTGRIYYAPKGIQLSVILHETVHSAFKGAGERRLYDPDNPKADKVTGVVRFGPGTDPLSDKELQVKLGIKVQSDTRNITTNLETNGCK